MPLIKQHRILRSSSSVHVSVRSSVCVFVLSTGPVNFKGYVSTLTTTGETQVSNRTFCGFEAPRHKPIKVFMNRRSKAVQSTSGDCSSFQVILMVQVIIVLKGISSDLCYFLKAFWFQFIPVLN